MEQNYGGCFDGTLFKRPNKLCSKGRVLNGHPLVHEVLMVFRLLDWCRRWSGQIKGCSIIRPNFPFVGGAVQ